MDTKTNAPSFTVSLRGYDREEVDEYLDSLAEALTRVEEAETHTRRLQAHVAKCNARIKDLEDRIRADTPKSAVALGLLMWTPGVTYLSAMKLVSDAAPQVAATVLSTLLLTFCVLILVEIPIVTYLLFPEATNTKLKAFDGWLHRHARTMLIWGFSIAGSFMLGYGIFRLFEH